jgi:hypothetical protein
VFLRLDGKGKPQLLYEILIERHGDLHLVAIE